MYTSWFGNLKNISSPLSIARRPPRSYDGPEYLLLAPPMWLVNKIHQGKITEEQYIDIYMEEVLDKLDAPEVYLELTTRYGPDVTLLCWEPPGDFCHRQIVATWFGIQGIEMTEMPKKGRSNVLRQP